MLKNENNSQITIEKVRQTNPENWKKTKTEELDGSTLYKNTNIKLNFDQKVHQRANK